MQLRPFKKIKAARLHLQEMRKRYKQPFVLRLCECSGGYWVVLKTEDDRRN